jgi:predicted NUDIX family NTP pyrophosphohydrolase
MKNKSCGILIQCGCRYLLVHATKKWAPLLKDDNHWSFPKGGVDSEDYDELSAAIRETREETGVDLSRYRDQMEDTKIEYDGKKKHFVVFKYVDEDMKLMNFKFNCESYVEDEKTGEKLFPEVDRFYWATQEEVEDIISKSHKGKLFKDSEELPVVNE